MAKRICFISTPNEKKAYDELVVEFEYFNGFAITQKQKSIKSLHEKIKTLNPSLKILEVSTKSPQSIGFQLSAFNLVFFDENSGKEFPIENIFQSSKVFEEGGPYKDLMYVKPRDAKRDERLRSSGALKYFELNNQKWGLEPKSIFYDWIYINAVLRNNYLVEEIIKYDAFTDIEFNHNKSFNCQARSASIFVSLYRSKKLEAAVKDKEQFAKIYDQLPTKYEQGQIPYD